MKIAYIILAHQDPAAVARLAKRLIRGSGIVSIHYDLRSGVEELRALEAALGDDRDVILWPQRVSVAWGEWSIVQATLNAIDAISASGEDVDYVHLMSGSDYPIRPLSDFENYLERNRETNFIECVDMMSADWVKGGLTHERYQYRHYFNWKSRGELFDRSLRFQQGLGLKRKFPQGLTPYIGSQWWTLSWRSILAVQAAGRSGRLRKFFRSVWIPDEIFIQSVVANLIPVPSIAPNLTLYQFAENGVPVVYYDDHAEYLSRQPFFFARKMSRHARNLKDRLDRLIEAPPIADAAVGSCTDEYQNYLERAVKPRADLRVLGYEKDAWRGDLLYQKVPLFVIYGASHQELTALAKCLNEEKILVCHGALFHPERIEFVGGRPSYAGYAADDIALRDNKRTTFLRDVASVTDDLGATAFLLPWTMDDHVRDRMVWCSFSRNLVVKGNKVRAFEEYRERINRPLADEVRGRTKPSGMPIQDFHNFSESYEAYHANLLGELNAAGAVYTEIDLLDGKWRQNLMDFIRLNGVPDISSRAPVSRPLFDAIGGHPLSSGARNVAGASHVLDLVNTISDPKQRQAHLKDLARHELGELPLIVVPLFGASGEELTFLGNLLEDAGIMVCHGALFSSRQIEFAESAPECGGYRNDDIGRRDFDRGHFLSNIAAEAEKQSKKLMGFTVPWKFPGLGEVEHLLIWSDFARIVIVRGNILRVFLEQRRIATGSEDGDRKLIPLSEIKTFIERYEEYYQALRDECILAKADFLEIDLMDREWFEKLLEYFRIDGLVYEAPFKAKIIDGATNLRFKPSKDYNTYRFINSIESDKSRAAHLLALDGP